MAKSYKFHLGEYVRRQFEHSEISKAEASRKIGVGKNALSERFKREYYGTVYDLLETSEILGVDLFLPVNTILKKGDFKIDEIYTKTDIELLENKIKELEERVSELKDDKRHLYELLHNTIDRNGTE